MERWTVGKLISIVAVAQINRLKSAFAAAQINRLKNTFAVALINRLKNTLAVTQINRLKNTFAAAQINRLKNTFAVAQINRLKSAFVDAQINRLKSAFADAQINRLKNALAVALILICPVIGGCGFAENDDAENVVYVYSWGDYLDPATLEMFEEETGIHVVLDEYDTNESMYPRIAEGAVHYDVICPSDYMIQKMIHNNLLQPLDFEKLPTAKEYIGAKFFEQSQAFDPDNKYSVPYCWGTVGIMYDSTQVDAPVDSWEILWDEKYRNEILMQDSSRDALMIPLKLLGRSLNETDKEFIAQARDMLIAQKPLVQAYVVDEAKDKLISGEAIMGVVFSGEALMISLENENMEFAVPKEGTNFWIDSWVVTRDAENVDNAHKFIDFMCRPEIAVINFDYLGYSTPNIAVRDLEEDEEYKNSPVAFPDPDVYENQETYIYLGNEMDRYYNRQWMRVKVE